MKKTDEIKLMIIENYIDWFTSNDDERDEMKENARLYVKEDWVDEVGQTFPEVLAEVDFSNKPESHDIINLGLRQDIEDGNMEGVKEVSGERTGSSPDNWTITIEADEWDCLYHYDSKSEFEGDLVVAKKMFKKD